MNKSKSKLFQKCVMPLNKHKIFYVLLSFLIDEVNHTAQPKIVAAYNIPTITISEVERNFVFYFLIKKNLIEKLNGAAYNLNCDPIVRFMNIFSDNLLSQNERFFILCSHNYKCLILDSIRTTALWKNLNIWKAKANAHTLLISFYFTFFFTH